MPHSLGGTAHWIAKGLGEVREGSDAEAARCFLRAQKLSPGEESSLMYLGEILARSGKLAQALRVFSAATGRRPGNAMGLAYLSQIKRRLGRTEEGLRDLERAVRAERGCLWMLSLGYGRARNKPLYDRELAALDALIEKYPAWGLVYAVRAVTLAHAREKSLERVDADIRRAMALDPANAWAVVWLGEAHRWEGRHRQAVALFNQAAAAGFLDQNLLVRRGESRLWFEDFRRALADFDLAVSLEKASGAIVAWRAEIKLWGGDWAGALADCQAALSASSPALWAHGWRGAALLKLGRRQRALEALDLALEKDPVDAEALTWRGEAHRLSRRWKPALRDLNRAIELRPFLSAYLNRGLAFGELGEDAGLRQDFVRALSLGGSLFKEVLGGRPPAGDRRGMKATLSKALALSLGNRTAHPSFLASGGPGLRLRDAS